MKVKTVHRAEIQLSKKEVCDLIEKAARDGLLGAVPVPETPINIGLEYDADGSAAGAFVSFDIRSGPDHIRARGEKADG